MKKMMKVYGTAQFKLHKTHMQPCTTRQFSENTCDMAAVCMTD